MTDKTPFDLDAALAALEQDERAAWPKVSENLQMRVLGDAAEYAGAVVPVKRVRAMSGGFRLFGLFDIWSGAAVAAIALCLFVGLGVGYEVGPEVMAKAGLGDAEIIFAADDGEFAPFEDVL